MTALGAVGLPIHGSGLGQDPANTPLNGASAPAPEAAPVLRSAGHFT